MCIRMFRAAIEAMCGVQIAGFFLVVDRHQVDYLTVVHIEALPNSFKFSCQNWQIKSNEVVTSEITTFKGFCQVPCNVPKRWTTLDVLIVNTVHRRHFAGDRDLGVNERVILEAVSSRH